MAFKSHLTPLTQLKTLTDSQCSALQEKSVTTVEELLGIIDADPAGTRSLLMLEESQFSQLRKKARSLVSPEFLRSMEAQRGKEYSLGALDPRLRRRQN